MRCLLLPLLFMGLGCCGQWTTLGAGMDNPVRDVLYDADSDRLYAVGGFRTAGGDTVNGAAWWDGATWHAMGGGLQPDAPAVSIARSGAELVVAGLFQYADTASNTFKLACWMNDAWANCEPGSNPNYSVVRAQFLDSVLYLSGGFTTIGDVAAENVAFRADGVWHAVLPEGFLDPIWGVYCVERYQDDLYIAGNLMASNGLSDIGRVVGDSLVGLGQGIVGDPWVNDMIVYNGVLWVGGYFFQGAGNAASMLMCWNGSEWFDPFPQAEITQQVRRFLIHDGDLYIAAPISLPGETGYHPLARFDGENLCLLGGNGGLVYALAGNNDQLYCAVSYDPFGPDSLDANWIASLDLNHPADTCIDIASGFPNLTGNPLLRIWPNPTDGILHLEAMYKQPDVTYLRLFDAMGRVVLEHQITRGHTTQLDLTDLPSGSFYLKIWSGDLTQTTRVAKY